MTETELKAFQETAEYNTYLKIIKFSDDLNTPLFDENKMYQKIMATPKSKPKVVSFYQSKWLKIAALLIVFCSLTFVVKSKISFTEYKIIIVRLVDPKPKIVFGFE